MSRWRSGLVVLVGVVLSFAVADRPATAQVGNMFFLDAPCRLFDTRTTPGAPRFGPSEVRTVQVAGACGVPFAASAVFLNVTVTNPAGGGYLTVFRGDEWIPVAAALNFDAGETLTNDVAAPLASNGSGTMRIFSAISATDVIVDVLGYAATASTAPSGSQVGPLGFQPVKGCRLADTRVEGGALFAGEDRPIDVQGRCDVPASAPVAALNVVAVSPAASGFLEAHRSDQMPPGFATVSFPAGHNVAGATLTRLPPTFGGEVGIRNASGGAVHAIVDALGYFGAEARTRYRPITPCRLFDTRQTNTPWLAGENRTVSTGGCLGIVNTTWASVGLFVNLTVVGPSVNGHLITGLPGSSPPIVSSFMNFSAGEPALGHGGILEVDKGGDLTIRASLVPGASVHLVADVYGYFETPTSSGQVGTGGSALVMADGIHPANDRGVDAGKLYDFGDLDTVNLSNGNLNVKLPIGDRYPVGGGLTYGFQLSYNSKVWDYRLRRVASGNHWIHYTESLPNQLSNAGLSWMLSLGGQLLSPSDVENNSGGPIVNGRREDPQPRWLWVGPDGNEHIFYDRLNSTVDAPGGTMLWTRDGTYLRLRNDPANSNAKELEFPDGTIYRFELRALPIFNGGTQNKWLLASMKNRFAGNNVSVDYQRTTENGETVVKWVVTDSHGRRQEVVFQRDPSGTNPAGRARFVRLSAPHNQTAEWRLEYLDTSIGRCRDTWPNNSSLAAVSQLVQVVAPIPVSTSFSFTYNPGAQTSTCSQGLLARMAVPTAGTALTACNGTQHCAGIEWIYGDYTLPRAPCDNRVHFSTTPGVVEKHVFDTTGAASPAGKWTFQPALANVGTPRSVTCPDRELPPDIRVENFFTFTNTVTTPLLDQTVHHFSVLPRPNYDWARPADIVDKWEEYGLPLDRRTSITGSDGQPLFLSEEIKDCAGATCTPLATKYVRYERDNSLFFATAENTDGYDLQQRLKTERTVHLPGKPAEHWVETRREEFDGVGHYRKVTDLGGGWSLAGAARSTKTDYNSGNGNYALDDNGAPIPGQHTYSSLAARASWRLDTYASIVRTQGASVETEQACHNAQTGFLDRRRLYVNGTGAGGRDVIIVYGSNDGQGNVTSETFYGGDKATLDTGDVCSPSFPFPAPGYATRRSYTGGMSASVEWMDGGTTVLRRYLAGIDVNGARVVSTTAPDGIRTDYSYDLLGRLEQMMPGNGQSGKFSAWTRYTYGRAATGGCVPSSPDTCASLLVEHFNPGSFSTLLSRQRHVYDGLGRVIRDGIRVPNDSRWSDVVTAYNGMGEVSFRSERHTTTTFGTTFQNFDALSRPTRIVPPSGGSQAVDLVYSGVQSETRTTQVARFNGAFPTTPNAPRPAISEQSTATVTTFDALRRVVRLLDDSTGPAANQLTTTYTYDVGDRLTSVRSGSPVQARDFKYDGLGRLRGEDYPELTHVTGSSTVCGAGARANDVVYDSYDVLGNLLRKCDDEADLVFKYDKAQRLTQVRLAGSNPNGDCAAELNTCLKRFTYGTGTTLGDRSNGKVIQASAFNYRSDNGPFGQPMWAVGEIAYDYAYNGSLAVDGGLSSRTLRFNASTNPTLPPQPASERFTQTFSYTPLGAPEKVNYPTCDFAGCNTVPPSRSITLTYNEGLLVGVGGYGNLAYAPNPMVRRVDFTNGRIWQLDPDLQNQPRARFICSPAPGTPASQDCTGGLGPYTYDGEGNVKSVGGETYAYDAHRRAVYGQMSSGQYQRYAYDLVGNMQSKTYGMATFPAPGVVNVTDQQLVNLPTDSNTNRLQTAAYDARGNLIAWSGNIYRHDALDRLGVVHAGSKVRWYFYDVDGERVLSFEPPEFTPDTRPTYDWTLRDLDGKVLRSLRLTRVNGVFAWAWLKDFVYRDDTALAYETPAGRGQYIPDHLGTPRIVWNESGVPVGHHYYAFGEEVFFQSGDAETVKFTGHERDLLDTTGQQDDLDNMHARFYNPQLGRFLSVDPVSGEAGSAQSWNRYSYTRNNPLKFVDPDGEEVRLGTGAARSLRAIRLSVPSNVRNAITTTQDSRGRTIVQIAGGTQSTDVNFKNLQRAVNSPGIVQINQTPANQNISFNMNGAQQTVQLSAINEIGLTLPTAGTAGGGAITSTTPGVIQVHLDAGLSAYRQAPVVAAELAGHAVPGLLGQGASVSNPATHAARENPAIAAARRNRLVLRP